MTWGRSRSAVWLTVIISAVVAAFAGVEPTSLSSVDPLLLGAFGALVATASAFAPVSLVIAAAGVTLALATLNPAAVPIGLGAGSTGLALWAGIRPRHVRRPWKAAGGLLLAQAILRLEGGGAFTGDTALVGGLVAAALGVGALVRLRSPTRRVIMLTTLSVVAVSTLAAAGTGTAVLGAREDVEAAVDAVDDGLDALRDGDGDLAANRFEAAARLFASAEGRLNEWWARGGRAVPVVSQNYTAVETLTSIGEDLAITALDTADAADIENARLDGGRVDLAAIRAMEEPLDRSLLALVSAREEALAIESPWLADPLVRARSDLIERIDDALPDVEDAIAAARVAPALLGADEPRHYFVAIVTPAESRASGGFMGNFAELRIDAGEVEMTTFGRAHELNEAGERESKTLEGAPPDYVARYEDLRIPQFFQDVGVSPDFPSVARVIEGLYPQSGGRSIDGVISVDPDGLAGLLELTGPVEIPQLGEPVTSENASDLLLREQYVRFADDKDERVDFLETTARAVFDEITSGSLPGPGRIADVLGPLARRGRITLHSVHQPEQSFFENMGIGGAYPPVRGHFVGVVTQNGGLNKIDTFLHRSVRYEAAVDPATGRTDALVEVTLRNEAPAAGLPDVILGGGIAPSGTNRSWLSVYSPLEFVGAERDGEPLEMERERELGRRVYSAYVDVPPQSSVTVRVRLFGTVPVVVEEGSASLRVDVAHQPLVHPDDVELDIRFSEGWRVAESGDARFRRTFTLENDSTTSIPLLKGTMR